MRNYNTQTALKHIKILEKQQLHPFSWEKGLVHRIIHGKGLIWIHLLFLPLFDKRNQPLRCWISILVLDQLIRVISHQVGRDLYRLPCFLSAYPHIRYSSPSARQSSSLSPTASAIDSENHTWQSILLIDGSSIFTMSRKPPKHRNMHLQHPYLQQHSAGHFDLQYPGDSHPHGVEGESQQSTTS